MFSLPKFVSSFRRYWAHSVYMEKQLMKRMFEFQIVKVKKIKKNMEAVDIVSPSTNILGTSFQVHASSADISSSTPVA